MNPNASLLDRAGLKWGDVEEVYMSFSQQVIALRNGAIDLALPAEPQASDAIRNGAAIKTEETGSGRLFELIRNMEMSKRLKEV